MESNLLERDGVEISREDELVIEDIYFKKSWITNPEKWGVTGEETRAIDTYLKGIYYLKLILN